jgi:hypothetical protein
MIGAEVAETSKINGLNADPATVVTSMWQEVAPGGTIAMISVAVFFSKRADIPLKLTPDRHQFEQLWAIVLDRHS